MIVGIETVRRFSPRTLNLGSLEFWRNRPNDACGNLVLKIKNVVQFALEPTGPEKNG
jgi:hypothetical protein